MKKKETKKKSIDKIMNIHTSLARKQNHKIESFQSTEKKVQKVNHSERIYLKQKLVTEQNHFSTWRTFEFTHKKYKNRFTKNQIYYLKQILFTFSTWKSFKFTKKCEKIHSFHSHYHLLGAIFFFFTHFTVFFW